ncbi:RagB/SusD family nutrient uptake outer membrane protein [Dyadobacter aurulentus]|uniref:RagB/SusD family nutrient uptake outer membrane protein n=1 Tax=Dyadobacter sp. UC 10 TaxID=2605428 RepID=UPI0011F106D3|nr:RagB/SusD family nutrient uptake outer membrane protein [Dyadobacter sp. UC 10]KAA0993367.1 RagB/SusD family nutrient uptake outer membrane protein [Dyadobacter sp. UC 10]
MKKKYLAMLCLLGFVATSCDDSFIELTPKDQFSAGTFFQTESQFRQAVTAAYVPLRDLLINDFYVSEMRSDNTHYQFAANDRGTAIVHRENIGDFTDQSTNSYTNAVYFHCYSGISKANIVIERLAAADIPDAAKAEIDGQAKFLRAFNYFLLVRYYGEVPLYLKEIVKVEDTFVDRSPVESVYNQIIADATDAMTKLAAPARFPQNGQVTKGAATMLLAEVYMTQKKYAQAEQLLNTLPAMGYGLNAAYADAFSVTNKNSKESIFEVQYLEGTAAGSQPSNFIYYFLPRTTNSRIITTFGSTVVATNNTGTGGWNTPTEDMIKAYETGDKRLDVSIGIAEGTYNASGYLTISASKSAVGYVPEAGKTGVPFIKKYLGPHSNPNNTNNNWPIYRYSDALLLLAESLNEQGKSAQALAPLNEVRTRAGLANVTQTAQAALRETIAHERRIELAFENHRWLDLVRTGKAIEVMNAHGAELKKQYSYLSSDSYQVTAEKLLLPIPQSERELNPGLTQNAGY